MNLENFDRCPAATNYSVVLRSGARYKAVTITAEMAKVTTGGSSFLSLGNLTILQDATTLVTVDTTGARALDDDNGVGNMPCVAVGGVLLKYLGPISTGEEWMD